MYYGAIVGFSDRAMQMMGIRVPEPDINVLFVFHQAVAEAHISFKHATGDDHGRASSSTAQQSPVVI